LEGLIYSIVLEMLFHLILRNKINRIGNRGKDIQYLIELRDLNEFEDHLVESGHHKSAIGIPA
jgi:hypothetical protein